MISVFVLVDALGWELIRNRPFLAGVLPYRRELKTVFGFSSGAIPSILTGLAPREHGHWNLFVYDPGNSPFRWAKPLAWLPGSLRNHRVVRKAVSILGRIASGTSGYFQIYGVPVELLPYFDLCEKENIYAPGGMRPAQSIFDRLEAAGVPNRVYSYHDYTDDEAMSRAVADLRRGDARVYFLYLAELDAFLHQHVQSREAVDGELDRYAGGIRRLFEAAVAADPDAAFYVFSDHGMTPIRETFDLAGLIGRFGWRVPRDYIALYDATMARLWFFREEARAEITQALAGVEQGHTLSAAEQRALGIDFDDNRFGDLVFAMRPGCIIHPGHMGRTVWPGMHGFDPAHISSSAALLARSEPPVAVTTIRDIHALMCEEAGICAPA